MSTKAVDTFSRRLPPESALLMQLGGADSRQCRPPNGRCPVRPSRCSGQAQTRNPASEPDPQVFPGRVSSFPLVAHSCAPTDGWQPLSVGGRWAAGLHSLTLRPVLAPQQMGSSYPAHSRPGRCGGIPGNGEHTRDLESRSQTSRVGGDRMGALSSIPHGREAPVPNIGDRVRFESTKVGQVPRDGVVVAVDGELLHIEWSTGGESSLVPGAGSITIVGKVSGKTAANRTTKKRTPARKATKKAVKKSAPAKKRTPARKATKKAVKKSAPVKKRTPARKATKKAVKAPVRKRPAKTAANR